MCYSWAELRRGITLIFPLNFMFVTSSVTRHRVRKPNWEFFVFLKTLWDFQFNFYDLFMRHDFLIPFHAKLDLLNLPIFHLLFWFVTLSFFYDASFSKLLLTFFHLCNQKLKENFLTISSHNLKFNISIGLSFYQAEFSTFSKLLTFNFLQKSPGGWETIFRLKHQTIKKVWKFFCV